MEKALRAKERELNIKRNDINIILQHLAQLQDTQVVDTHEDGSAKLDENKQRIVITKKPIDTALGIEMSDERRDAIFAKLHKDYTNL